MASSTAPFAWPSRLVLVGVVGFGALVLIQAVRSGGDETAPFPKLVPDQPIEPVDARLRSEGWVASPERKPSAYERRLARNNLSSLSA